MDPKSILGLSSIDHLKEDAFAASVLKIKGSDAPPSPLLTPPLPAIRNLFENPEGIIHIPLHSFLRSQEYFNVSEMPLVDVTFDITVFNFCALENYHNDSASKIKLLEMHGITNASSPWVAYFNDKDFVTGCPNRYSMSWSDSITLYWAPLLAKKVQAGLGANGMISVARYSLDYNRSC